MRGRVDDATGAAPVLGAFSYLVLVILDLATTTVLLRGFPHQAVEANRFLADVLDAHGFAGLWAVKAAGALFAVALYAAVRASHPRLRGLADTSLVLCCVVQGAIVLANIASFATLAL